MPGLFHFLLRWKIQAHEKALAVANRKSFYEEQTVGVGAVVRAQKAFEAKRYSAAIDELYAVLKRFHDYSSAYHLLGRVLEKVGEKYYAYENYKRALQTFRDTMHGIDDIVVDDFLRVGIELGLESATIHAIEKMVGKDRKLAKRLESLRRQGRL
jgi:tetratricopeptide (TPR) repeat protein